MSTGEDPRMSALSAAVDRLGGELGDYEAALADREVAERQLAALRAMSAAREPDGVAMRDALLLIAAAVGSVSALAPAVARLREAVEAFGVPHTAHTHHSPHAPEAVRAASR
ncbi:DUF5955 family protein [Streptomyces sp. 6N223]|uniref:DUF5955 family protein n=1 Tax=Streptomyces sp. 6N223 TaxID=3457412 RepID=UPI003FCFB5FF